MVFTLAPLLKTLLFWVLYWLLQGFKRLSLLWQVKKQMVPRPVGALQIFQFIIPSVVLCLVSCIWTLFMYSLVLDRLRVHLGKFLENFLPIALFSDTHSTPPKTNSLFNLPTHWSASPTQESHRFYSTCHSSKSSTTLKAGESWRSLVTGITVLHYLPLETVFSYISFSVSAENKSSTSYSTMARIRHFQNNLSPFVSEWSFNI